MKNIFSLVLLCTIFACQKPEIISSTIYDCALTNSIPTHPKAAEFQALLDDLIKITPAVQATVQTKDGLVWTGAAGKADLPNDIDVETCHPFMIGSISKVFTAALIFQLQDEGLLNVEDPLKDHLDAALLEPIENANEVTLLQVLNHTSGIRDYLAVEHFVDALNTPNFTLTQEEKLEYIHNKSALFSPGDRYEYSNSNYVLLGLVIEKARGMNLWDAVDQFIAQPLGLENLKMGTEENPIPEGVVRPYLSTNQDKYFDIMENAVSDAATGDGGIASNMHDLYLFTIALFEGDLISDESLTQMTTTLVDAGRSFREDERDEYGLGIERYEFPQGVAIGHTGSTSAYNSVMFYIAEHEVYVSYAYNAVSEDSTQEFEKYELYQRLLAIIFE